MMMTTNLGQESPEGMSGPGEEEAWASISTADDYSKWFSSEGRGWCSGSDLLTQEHQWTLHDATVMGQTL